MQLVVEKTGFLCLSLCPIFFISRAKHFSHLHFSDCRTEITAEF